MAQQQAVKNIQSIAEYSNSQDNVNQTTDIPKEIIEKINSIDYKNLSAEDFKFISENYEAFVKEASEEDRKKVLKEEKKAFGKNRIDDKYEFLVQKMILGKELSDEEKKYVLSKPKENERRGINDECKFINDEYRNKAIEIGESQATWTENIKMLTKIKDPEKRKQAGIALYSSTHTSITINYNKATGLELQGMEEFLEIVDEATIELNIGQEYNTETYQINTKEETTVDQEEYSNDEDIDSIFLSSDAEENFGTFVMNKTQTMEISTTQLTNAEVEIAVSNEMKGTPDYAELYGHLKTKEQEDISLEADQVVVQQVVMETVIQEEISQEQNSIQAKQIQPEAAKSRETTQIEQTAVANEQVVKQDDYESPTFETERKGLRKLFGGIADFFSGKRKLGSNNQKVLNAGGDEKANTVYQEKPSKESFGLADSTNGLVPTRVGIRNTLGNIGKSLMNLFSSNKKEPDVITNQATIVDENGTVSTPDIFAVSDEVKKATIEVSKKAAKVKAEQNNQPIIPTTKKIENAHQANDGPVIE